MMKFVFNEKSPKWKNIKDVRDWVKSFESSSKDEIGRSALSLAEFCSRATIEEEFNALLQPVFQKENFILHTAQPEKSSRFDNYRKQRIHDLAIYGQTDSGKSIFVGVEAKVNETYNYNLSQIYDKAKKEQLNGKSTMIPQRIEELIEKYFPSLSTRSSVRYQILYAIAGTLCEQCNYNILLFLTFKTCKYKKTAAQRNKKDLMDVLNSIKHEVLAEGYYKCTFGDKILYIIDQTVDTETRFSFGEELQ